MASMRGLAVGDAFGRVAYLTPGVLDAPASADEPLVYTDDTRMALAIGRMLLARGAIEQDELARMFSRDFIEQEHRGYGAVAYYILHRIEQGEPWRDISGGVYQGTGSKGNGAAMRVAPLGAYFAHESVEDVLEQAQASAEVTHMHPEGIAGAQAVALLTHRLLQGGEVSASSVLSHLCETLPESAVRAGIEDALELGACEPLVASRTLGSGVKILAEDTVPLCAWIVAHAHHDFEAAGVRGVRGS